MVARRTSLALGGVALALALAVSGCSSDSGDESGGGEALHGAAAAPGEAPAQAPAQDKDAAGSAAQQPQQPQSAGGAGGQYQADDRAVIYNGAITVQVKEADGVNKAATDAAGYAEAAQGFVGGDKRTSDGTRSEARLTLRVPYQRFNAVLAQLAGLGEEKTREVTTEDVTGQVVDLDARIQSQRASVNRTRVLLSQARTIGEIVSVEAELAKREAELNSLESRKRRLDDLTTLSTINLTLLGPDAEPVVQKEEDDSGFLAGLKAGWKALAASATVTLTVIGAILPWLLLVAIPVAVFLYLRRRRTLTPPPPA